MCRSHRCHRNARRSDKQLVAEAALVFQVVTLLVAVAIEKVIVDRLCFQVYTVNQAQSVAACEASQVAAALQITAQVESELRRRRRSRDRYHCRYKIPGA